MGSTNQLLFFTYLQQPLRLSLSNTKCKNGCHMLWRYKPNINDTMTSHGLSGVQAFWTPIGQAPNPRAAAANQWHVVTETATTDFFRQIKASMAAQLSWYQWQNTCPAGQWRHSYQDNQCSHLPVKQGMFPTRASTGSMQTTNAKSNSKRPKICASWV